MCVHIRSYARRKVRDNYQSCLCTYTCVGQRRERIRGWRENCSFSSSFFAPPPGFVSPHADDAYEATQSTFAYPSRPAKKPEGGGETREREMRYGHEWEWGLRSILMTLWDRVPKLPNPLAPPAIRSRCASGLGDRNQLPFCSAWAFYCIVFAGKLAR